MNRKQKKVLVRIIVTAVLFAAGEAAERFITWPGYEFQAVPWKEMIAAAIFLAAYIIIGYDILKKAFKGIIRGQVMDENFLMAVATLGAIFLGEYGEGVAVMLFYQTGELFQSVAVGKSRRNIAELMDIRPDRANLVTEDEDISQADPDEVAVGSTICVYPGEKIPIDGVVTKGESVLDTSALTGESVPRSVCPGDDVISGCINQSGVIYVRTTKEFGQSTVSKVLELVENASSRKSRSENFISRFAAYYTPAVCSLALAIAIIPPLVMLVTKGSADWPTYIYRALTFLVISCPCALVISIPLGFFAGIGGASKAGVLVKGSNYLEAVSKADTVIFDKTGTLTKGVFEVVSIHKNGMDDKELLEYAAYAEDFSTHPISRSIVSQYGKDIDRKRISDSGEIAGQGVYATVSGRQVLVGNDKLMRDKGIAYSDCTDGGTIVHVAIDGEYAGHIHISDVIKENSRKAIGCLGKMGIGNTVMLTGDAEEVAQRVAGELGIKDHRAELLPQDKVDCIEEIMRGREGAKGTVVFAGDGINDAPVLTRADVGIAMGALGSDAAIEAADIVLMDDDPMGIVKAVKIGRKCMRIIYENIYFAIGIKVLCLILSAFGIANMWIAIFADVGVMILAVLNSIRTLNVARTI